MRPFKTIIGIILFISLLGCAAPAELTKVGNPVKNPPDTSKAAALKYLDEHPFWKGSHSDETGDFYDMYLIRFDTYNLMATVYSLEYPDPVMVSFTINEDGSLSTTQPSEDGLKIEASFETDEFWLDYFQVNMSLINDSDVAISDLYSSDVTDDSFYDNFTDPVKTCESSELVCYDSDNELTGIGDYYVEGFIQLNGEDGTLCAGNRRDYCSPAGYLVELECNPDPSATTKYIKKIIDCPCQDGKCLRTTRTPPSELSISRGDINL